MWNSDEFQIVKNIVRVVCNVLSSFNGLDFLHIDFEGEAQKFRRVLESFTLIQNVRKVILEGVPPLYWRYLTNTATGSSPLDHLPRMYKALEFCAGPFSYWDKSLREACDAIEDDDVDRFKRARKEIITAITKLISGARAHLFDHNAICTAIKPGVSDDIDKEIVSAKVSEAVQES